MDEAKLHKGIGHCGEARSFGGCSCFLVYYSEIAYPLKQFPLSNLSWDPAYPL